MIVLPVMLRYVATWEFCVHCSACNVDCTKETSALKCIVLVEMKEETILLICFVKYWNHVPKL